MTVPGPGLVPGWGFPSGPWRGQREQLAALAAQVQHRGDPLQAARGPEDGDPSAARSLVHAPAVGYRGVEAAGERDRGGVADGELHCRHGADPAARQGGGRAGEQVVHSCLPG